MSKADTDHGGPSGDGLMAGLNIKSGIPNVVPGSNEEDTIDDVGSGTANGAGHAQLGRGIDRVRTGVLASVHGQESASYA